MEDIIKRKENFIKKAVSIYGEEKYDYSQIDYANNKTKVKIRCCKHNSIFEISPGHHIISGQECPKCSDLKWRGLDADLPDNLSFIQEQVVIGSLLGDGSLTKIYKNQNSRFSEDHGNKQEEYLLWKRDILSPFSFPLAKIKSSKLIHLPNSKIIHSLDEFYDDGFNMRTRSHLIFTALEKDWYVEGKKQRIKIIPNNIEDKMTWLVIAIWFMDDGSNEKPKRKAKFASMSFAKEECNKLIDILLNKFGIECYLDKRRQICVATSHYLKFMIAAKNSFEENDLIIPERMEYKFDISEYKEPNYRNSPKLNIENIQEIFEMRKSGLSYKKIAEKFNIDRKNISRVLAGKTYRKITSNILSGIQ